VPASLASLRVNECISRNVDALVVRCFSGSNHSSASENGGGASCCHWVGRIADFDAHYESSCSGNQGRRQGLIPLDVLQAAIRLAQGQAEVKALIDETTLRYADLDQRHKSFVKGSRV